MATRQIIQTQQYGYGVLPAGVELIEDPLTGEIIGGAGRITTGGQLAGMAMDAGVEMGLSYDEAVSIAGGGGATPPAAPAPAVMPVVQKGGVLPQQTTRYNGVATTLYTAGVPVTADPMLFGAVAGVAIRTLPALWAWIMAQPWWLKIVGSIGLMKIIDAITGGKEFTEQDLIDEASKKVRGAKRRYTIGHNPRVRTLQRVARHTQRLIKRHQKLLKEFEPRTKTVYVGASRYLSPVEKAELKRK